MITTRDGFANSNKRLIQSDITTTNTSGTWKVVCKDLLENTIMTITPEIWDEKVIRI